MSENADKIIVIKNKLTRILNEKFEITNYENDNTTIKIFIKLPDNVFDVEIFKEINGMAHYYCLFHNNKREYDFDQTNITRQVIDIVRYLPDFVEIFYDRLDYWLF